MQFTDSRGRRWIVIDYKVVDGKKKRVTLGSWTAEGRAFQPDGWESPVMLFRFGYVAYHTTEPNILQHQLDAAKPVSANAAERMQRNEHHKPHA